MEDEYMLTNLFIPLHESRMYTLKSIQNFLYFLLPHKKLPALLYNHQEINYHLILCADNFKFLTFDNSD